MRTDRSRTTVLRFVSALVFGFMSIVQMPMMAFAKTADSHPNHVSTTGTGHHHHDATVRHHGDAQPFSYREDRTAPQAHDGAAICSSTACCVAVIQPAMPAPASALLLIGQLRASLARVIVAVPPEPVVPPPRLQA